MFTYGIVRCFLGNTSNGDHLRYFGIIKKNCFLMAVGGVVYGFIEILWRGKTHWSMILTGGFCFAVLNAVYKKFADMLLVKKCLLGSAIITSVEFLCGMIVNVKLKWNVWDYSHLRFNIKGQVCLLYSALWSLLCLPVCAVCKLMNRKGLPQTMLRQSFF